MSISGLNLKKRKQIDGQIEGRRGREVQTDERERRSGKREEFGLSRRRKEGEEKEMLMGEEEEEEARERKTCLVYVDYAAESTPRPDVALSGIGSWPLPPAAPDG